MLVANYPQHTSWGKKLIQDLVEDKTFPLTKGKKSVASNFYGPLKLKCHHCLALGHLGIKIEMLGYL